MTSAIPWSPRNCYAQKCIVFILEYMRYVTQTVFQVFPRDSLSGGNYQFGTVFLIIQIPLWRHQMETFSALLTICAGNSPVPGEFPTQRPMMRSFDVFFDLHPNKRFTKQWWGWWFETPSCPLWHPVMLTLYLDVTFLHSLWYYWRLCYWN